MDYFLKVFPTVSNLKVQINYSDPIDSLATDPTVIPMLKESLKKISKLKVWVLGQYMLSNITIL